MSYDQGCFSYSVVEWRVEENGTDGSTDLVRLIVRTRSTCLSRPSVSLTVLCLAKLKTHFPTEDVAVLGPLPLPEYSLMATTQTRRKTR